MGRVALPAVLIALLLIAAGCGAKKEEAKPTAEHYGPDTVSTEGSDVEIGTRSGVGDERAAARNEAKPSGQPNRVRLTQHGCVEFEPKWTTIRVGQSLSWHSDLKASVTIHVPAGAFDKTEYVVRAGQNLSTGPARRPGNYPVWSNPAACQGIARGVQGSGPGVAVEGEPTR